METKEIILRIDPNALAVVELEMKRKREAGAANAVGDRFLIRLLEALSNNTRALLFKIEKNKLIIRNYATAAYDDDRQARTSSGETDRTHSQPVV